MSKIIDFKEVELKNKRLNDVTIQLKKDFVGIDKQIDQIINTFRTWYLFPNLQNRPVVINLYGLTGVGKTSLVKSLAKYLDLEKDLVYFNFAAIDEMTAYEIEDSIETELSNEKSNRIFVYDEFQYAATLDEQGNEKEKKSGLKPFWELLDSGVINKRDSLWNLRTITNILRFITKISSNCKIELVDGEWVNQNDCLRNFSEWDVSQFQDFFNITGNNVDENGRSENEKMRPLKIGEKLRKKNDDNFIFNSSTFNNLYTQYCKVDNSIDNIIDFYHYLCTLDIDALYELISDIANKLCKGYELNFKDSIIFVLGNLDEAYSVSFDINPDMSPDQYHKITEQITIVDIKKALQKRFRNEQIARLGNIHVIYPSFTSESFRKIIDLTLNNYKNDVKKETGYDLIFDDTIKDILYKESVFPTHGTRPIFSTVHEIVKSKFPTIVQHMWDIGDFDVIKTIKYSYGKKKIIIEYFDCDGVKLNSLKIDEKLKLNELRESTKDEEQAICALHESGHFVVYSKLNGKVPEKLVSRTTDSDAGGFILSDVDDERFTKRQLLNEIRVLLGGYIAEKMFFGEENMSCGASSDLNKATGLASKMVRIFGLGGIPYVSTYIKQNEFLLNEDNQDYINKVIKDIIYNCQEDVISIFNDIEWRNMLKKSAQYLSVKSSMSQKQMKLLYNEVSEGKRKTDISDTYYRNKINEI